MASSRRITINDVAEAAGVSVSTVSLVLSGKGRISSATGQRVNDAVARLGFVRNHQAAALRGGQSGAIGLIVRDLSHPFYADLAAGLSEALEQQGRMLFLTQSGSGGQYRQRCFDSLLAQGVDGIVIAGGGDDGGLLRAQAEQHQIPLIFASRAAYPDETEAVRPDNMQAARLLTEHLISRGHQRIAWLGGRSASLTRAERLGGFCATLMQYGLPFHSEWVLECEATQRDAARQVVALLRHNPTITAIICHDSIAATGAWFGLLRAGRYSGEGGMESYFDSQIALAAFAGVPEAALDDIPVTWATAPARDIGRSAAAHILQWGNDRAKTPGCHTVPARLVLHQG
ncbi:Mal regulon transcriptional regulator MalI [Apirhabdus apintestini]|uniref:Mal regulon transcriptional regulator MalI n=1 Tax=Erwinia sp. HR93 TaxID=3094840 RepID=UPI002ADED5A3|nr:Mal regulon transcriptional regulator MalI [Erwinia sp. HR93]MEA1065078.1 Mal regulon transcriptional regulator MalI [Erwinia sp. HR93]WPM85754.1 Mal regulon transcriptional regulator MalI [Enterobacteriaceae bacterium CA-0114]